MRGSWWFFIAGVSIGALPAAAQQPQPSQPAPQPPPAQQAQPAQPPQPAQQPQPAPVPQPAAQEGFFRPTDDPTLTRFPDLEATAARNAASDTNVAVVPVDPRSREALERDLDRAERESARALAEAARRPPPLIASPLDGTAPIVSPLDR